MPKKNKKAKQERDFIETDNSVWERLINDVVMNSSENQEEEKNSENLNTDTKDQTTIKPQNEKISDTSEPVDQNINNNNDSIRFTETIKLTHEAKYYSSGLSTNIGKRKSQQDAIACSNDDYSNPCDIDRIFAVLSDGMGGMNGGEKASNICVTQMMEVLKNRGNNYPNLFYDALVGIDDAVCSLQDDFGRPLQSGATIVSFVIENGDLYWASVGDSHLYVLHNNEMHLVTREHNYALTLQEMVENGEISESDALNDPKREALISFMGLGDMSVYDINSNPVHLEKDDIVMACSDGLYRSLSPQEILQIIMKNKSDIPFAAHLLTSAAIEKGNPYQDNTSVILVKKL